MWAHRLTAPGRLEAVDAPEPGDPGPGEVVARFEAGGICGSDLPSFLGTLDLLTGASHGHPGYPLHELVGEVVASGADDVPVGARVVGWAKGHLGLAEYFPARAGTRARARRRRPALAARDRHPAAVHGPLRGAPAGRRVRARGWR